MASGHSIFQLLVVSYIAIMASSEKTETELLLTCEGSKMTATFDASVLPYTNPSDVHFLDSKCRASDDKENEGAEISTDYHMCGTIMEETESYLIFKNTIIVGKEDPQSSIVAPRFNIECRVKRQEPVGAGPLSMGVNTKIAYANFTFNLIMFNDDTYSTPYSADDLPVYVTASNDVFLSAGVDTVNDLEVFLTDCWTTPTEDPLDSTRYALIEDGCDVDPSITRHKSVKSSEQRFSFRPFDFKTDHESHDHLIYVHCQILACDKNSEGSRCIEGCVSTKQK